MEPSASSEISSIVEFVCMCVLFVVFNRAKQLSLIPTCVLDVLRVTTGEKGCNLLFAVMLCPCIFFVG